MTTTALSLSPPGEPVVCKQCGAVIDVGANFCAVCGNAAQGESIPDPLVGQVVADRYRIMHLVGRGGMGVVYKCEHTRMGKVMAIKLLHGDLARDPEIQRRFRREAQAASKLSHPSTVSIFDFGTSDGLMYLVMEFVGGEDLGKVLRTAGYMACTRAAAIAAQACGSLAEAHENGIVHRDLKPENLLISSLKDGRDLVKLLDFGLAKLREGEERNEVTSSGTLIGTPYYMAPEVIRGQAADHRVDIYALGAVIYRSVTGTPPFTGNSPVAVLTRHITDELVPPSQRRPELGISPAIDRIVERAMKKDPADRYAQIDELRTELTDYLVHEGLADSLLRDSGLTSKHQTSPGREATSSKVSQKLVVATRNDVEAFERRLRRGKIAGWAAAGAILAAAMLAGAVFWRHQAAFANTAHDYEVEPNNAPEHATMIAPDVDVRGRIGQRLAVDRGDVDFFRLSPFPDGESRVRVELNPQPNIDTVVELLRAGQPTAVAVADDGPVGARQVIAGFRVSSGAQYYLSVHEHVRSGGIPMENVTDFYTVKYSVHAIDPTEETEPDDNEEIAQSLRLGTPVHGYIESHDDVDYWCLDAQTGPLHATHTPPTGLDLKLVVHPRDGAADTVADQTPESGVEFATIAAPLNGGRPPCLIVRGSPNRPSQAPGDGDHPYVLRVDEQ